MASRLSRSLKSLSSLVPFLAPSPASDAAHPAAAYSAIPLSSLPSSPADAEKQHTYAAPGAPSSTRRNALAHAWLWVSPILVLALAASTYLAARRPDSGVVDPYVCAPKSNWTLLRDVCAADRGADEQKVRLLPLDSPTHASQELTQDLVHRRTTTTSSPSIDN